MSGVGIFKVVDVGELRVAIPTKGKRGLQDEVAEVFSRAETITVIDLVNGEVKDVRVLQNPAASYRFGAGPIVVKTLADLKVEVVVASEVGPGASTLLEDQKIAKLIVKAGTLVSEAIKVAAAQVN
jgi:predicted Fe-Mo cluster-binding NifX family protein